MKQLFILFFLSMSFAAKAQTEVILEKMNNTVFVSCDSTATPIFKNGKAFYFIFDQSGRIDVRAGAEISEAIDSPVLFTGTWANKDKTVFWEWTESKKAGSAMFNEETNNLTTKSGMIYRFIGKY
jgi:hypothetical protein